ncbi:MAG TPA: hypothetical protein VK152_06790, partial [Paludibacter sp.]|nr:hypothetical protein [Paludibacter sp.]
TFSVEGEGLIAGVGNADIRDTDPYVGNSRKAWKGRAQVVIKSTHKAGEVKLKVSSWGLAEAVLNIKTNNKQ